MSRTSGWSGELELAQRAFAVGELPHALTHLGAALALAPTEERVVAAIEAEAAKRPLLEQVEDAPFIGNQLLRAWLMRRGGRVDDALELMGRLVQAFPNHRFEVLAASWLIAAHVAGTRLSPRAVQPLMGALVFVGEGTIGIHRLWAGERELLSGFEALADVLLEVGGDPNLPWVCAGLYRRLGLTQKALAALKGADGYFGFIQRGLVLRASGEARTAATEFTRARALPEANFSDTLELVRCHYVLGELSEARQLLATVERRGDPELEGLAALCAGAPPATAEEGVARLDRLRRTVHALPLECPPDATAKLFVTHGHQLEAGSARLQVAVSGWEPPSNVLLTALYASGTSDTATAQVTMEPPSLNRDPRAQTRGARAPTWRWDGDRPVQVTAAPSPELRARLAELAGEEGGLLELEERARAAAGTLTCTAAELMSALVHAPVEKAWLARLPHGLVRYQVAAALVLASKPWAECGAAFESLIFGPVDWCSAAAIHALAQRVRRETDGVREGHELLCSAVHDLVEHSCDPRGLALAHALRSIPTTPQEVLAASEAWWRKTQGAGADEAQEDADAAPAAGSAPQPTSSAPSAGGAFPLWGVILIVVMAVALLGLALK